jgi:hypothetical protein
MIKVYVSDYFVGSCRNIAEADSLAVGYATWLVSTGTAASGVFPFRYERDRRVVCRGDVSVEERPSSGPDSVKGAVGGEANP